MFVHITICWYCTRLSVSQCVSTMSQFIGTMPQLVHEINHILVACLVPEQISQELNINIPYILLCKHVQISDFLLDSFHMFAFYTIWNLPLCEINHKSKLNRYCQPMTFLCSHRGVAVRLAVLTYTLCKTSF